VGLWDAGTGSLAIEATSFFWFVFSATGKNEQYQAKSRTPQAIGNENREITIYAVEKHISV